MSFGRRARIYRELGRFDIARKRYQSAAEVAKHLTGEEWLETCFTFYIFGTHLSATAGSTGSCR